MTGSRVVAAVLVVAAAGCNEAVDEGPLPDQVVSSFGSPDSVVYDDAQDVYLVSDQNGQPTDKDNNGCIARVRPDGSVDRRWIQGGRDGVTLHAPKGLALDGHWLYVADIDTVRKFDRSTGASAGELPVAGATFLNDVSVAPDGRLWVTDTGLAADFSPTGTAAVHVIGADGVARLVASGPELGQPSGIVAREFGAYIVTWDTGAFLQVDGKGRITELLRTGAGKLDGLIRLGDGTWLCTSWTGKCVYELNAQGVARAVPGLALDEPADVGFDSRRRRLLIPLLGRGEVILSSY